MLGSIPKIMHFYWDGGALSYLQFMSVISFNKFNPDWKIIIHEPKSRYGFITWKTNEQRIRYSGPDWYPDLKNLSFVEFNLIDFNSIGFTEETPEVFKSDYLRWYLLSTVGGGWSDIDILYTKPVSNLDIGDSNTVICFRGDVHIIGFYLSKPNNVFFKNILDRISSDFDSESYQSIGSTLLNQIYPNGTTSDNNIVLKNIPMDCLYAYRDNEINKLFTETDLSNINEKTIGIHWYNGSNISKSFNNNYNPIEKNIKNTITEILNTIQ